jgi:hypothetical protein
LNLVVCDAVQARRRAPPCLDSRGREYKYRVEMSVHAGRQREHFFPDAHHPAYKLPDIGFVRRLIVKQKFALTVCRYDSSPGFAIQHKDAGRADDHMVKITVRGGEIIDDAKFIRQFGQQMPDENFPGGSAYHVVLLLGNHREFLVAPFVDGPNAQHGSQQDGSFAHAREPAQGNIR